MSFTANSTGGKFQYTLLRENLPKDVVANVNSAYGFGNSAYFKGAGWIGNQITAEQPFSIMQPYIAVYFWRRTA